MGILNGGKVMVGGLMDGGRGGWWPDASMVDGGVDVPLSNCWKATGTKGTELVKAIVHRIATIVTCSERMVSIGHANSERRKRLMPLPTRAPFVFR